jgi:hypothetical protein
MLAWVSEHHLKDIFKDIACNSQQRGQDTFLSQCATRMHEKLIITKAKHNSVMEALHAEVPTDIGRHDWPTSGNMPTLLVILSHKVHPMYVIIHHNTTNVMDGNG